MMSSVMNIINQQIFRVKQLPHQPAGHCYAYDTVLEAKPPAF